MSTTLNPCKWGLHSADYIDHGHINHFVFHSITVLIPVPDVIFPCWLNEDWFSCADEIIKSNDGVAVIMS